MMHSVCIPTVRHLKVRKRYQCGCQQRSRLLAMLHAIHFATREGTNPRVTTKTSGNIGGKNAIAPAEKDTRGIFNHHLL